MTMRLFFFVLPGDGWSCLLLREGRMSGAITKKIIAEGASAENDRYLVIVFDDPAAALQVAI